MNSIYTTFIVLLFPSIILCKLAKQSPTRTPRRTCTIATDLQTAMRSAPFTLQDIIIEFPSNLEKVLSKPAVITAGSDKDKRASETCRLLKYYSDRDHKYHLESINGLQPQQTDVTSFWITNVISLTNASKSHIEHLAKVKTWKPCQIRHAVRTYILGSPASSKRTQVKDTDSGTVAMASGRSPVNQNPQSTVNTPLMSPTVERIGARVAWDAGVLGQGVTVAVIDSGVILDHETLEDKYGGHWFDAVENKPDPIDPYGHGTAVTSVIVGRDIGVAPEAKFIACRAMDATGFGTEKSFLSCAQWISTFRPLGPLIVCNSWGNSTGGNPYFNKAIETWDSLGFHHVFAIGNSGPNCGSTRSPGDQEVAFSVGSVDNNDQPAPDSSRGPNPIQYNLKPDIAAPGVDINMAGINGRNDYVINSGTSFAAPHVAGAMALLLSRFVPLTSIEKQTRELREALISNARFPPLDTSSLQGQNDRCCFNAGKDYPHAAMGHGLLSLHGINFN